MVVVGALKLLSLTGMRTVHLRFMIGPYHRR